MIGSGVGGVGAEGWASYTANREYENINGIGGGIFRVWDDHFLSLLDPDSYNHK